ncbi:TPA: phage regulatory protein/antirepressor Ant [Bacillus cereus biovar anthracis]|nr:phage regulatory protein/antirepressor Ant [Bacillus cereus biovar anthracis]
MKELVFVNNNNEVVTDSLMVAEVFGKRHADVLRDIENLIEVMDEKGKRNFAFSTYLAGRRNYKKYNLTKDGFTLLVMGFTGKEAMKFKMMYIEEFNRMEGELKQHVRKLPETYLEALESLVESEKARLVLEHRMEKDRPKVEYHDRVLESESTYTATQIANEFGMSAIKMNRVLKSMGIQRKVGGQWVLRAAFMNQGYTDTKTYEYEDNKTNQQLRWTEKGRKFIHKLIDSIEQQSLDLA